MVHHQFHYAVVVLYVFVLVQHWHLWKQVRCMLKGDEALVCGAAGVVDDEVYAAVAGMESAAPKEEQSVDA